MKLVHNDDIRSWYDDADSMTAFLTSTGGHELDGECVENVIGMRLYLIAGKVLDIRV